MIIYLGYHRSGAHYNPAVSLAIRILRKMSTKKMIYYWITHIAAAFTAAFVADAVLDIRAAGAQSSFELITIGWAELAGTFFLMIVILITAASKRTFGNWYYGVAIGLTVVILAYFFGPYSGAALNPAVAVCQSINQLMSFNQIWMYILAQFVATAIAVFVFLATSPPDRREYEKFVPDGT